MLKNFKKDIKKAKRLIWLKLLFLIIAGELFFVFLTFNSFSAPASSPKSGQEEKISPLLLKKLTQDENKLITVWIYLRDKAPDLEKKITEARACLSKET